MLTEIKQKKKTVLFTITKIWKQPKYLIYMYIYTHIHTMEYYSAIKKNEILPFVTTWMDLECIMLSEISWKEKDKYHVIFTYMWNIKNKINEPTK